MVDEYKMCGFDLEIAKDLPEDGNVDWSVPLGVTCAGLATDLVQSWVAPDMEGEGYAPRIADISKLVDELVQYQRRGFHIVTWNGMGFDFRVMAQDAKGDDPLYDRICDLAWNHIDVAFQMRVEKGYMIGLDTAAKGLRVQGKTEGMSGAFAPVMWRQGFDEQAKVLLYVRQDAAATLAVCEALTRDRVLYWTTKKGSITKSPWFPMFMGADGPNPGLDEPRRLPTVKEVTRHCTPADTGWMSFKPTPLEEYYGWTGVFP